VPSRFQVTTNAGRFRIRTRRAQGNGVPEVAAVLWTERVYVAGAPYSATNLSQPTAFPRAGPANRAVRSDQASRLGRTLWPVRTRRRWQVAGALYQHRGRKRQAEASRAEHRLRRSRAELVRAHELRYGNAKLAEMVATRLQRVPAHDRSGMVSLIHGRVKFHIV
jgi:hypothetical protein